MTGKPGAVDAPGSPTGYSSPTRSVSDYPAGRAITIYQYGTGELFNMWQPLALGADRDTYRRIDAAVGRPHIKAWLLSPDGTTVLLAQADKATDFFELVNLTEGASRRARWRSSTWRPGR